VKIESIETIVANVPYRRHEVSAIVNRGGVTDVVIKVTADDGTIGWGEACSGPDVASVESALSSMIPFLVGCDIWDTEQARATVYHNGLWHLRPTTANFAWAGIDMALWDLRGKDVQLPVYKLLGGQRRKTVSYFYYLIHSDLADIAAQCRSGLGAGYSEFYIKGGIDFAAELAMIEAARDALGPTPRIRIDVNGGWSSADALRNLELLARFDIDFVEQPVRERPISAMAELRARSPIPLAQNEGLWTSEDATMRMLGRTADIYTFSPYWVGSIFEFQRLSLLADSLGFQVCKHTHGEFGIAAAASHHVLLTLPNVVTGNQQTASHNDGDILTTPVPIADGPSWGLPAGVGLGVAVDEELLTLAADRYLRDGQYLPYDKGKVDT
jgi:L-alanine-DL-glutamate epimerase-like enolase superfamily enzyme